MTTTQLMRRALRGHAYLMVWWTGSQWTVRIQEDMTAAEFRLRSLDAALRRAIKAGERKG